MKGFLQFVREQGVIGLAVGFILGGAISGLVKALVDDLIGPLIALALHRFHNIAEASVSIGSAKILWGDFVSVAINFVIVAAVVYFGVKGLHLDKFDQEKEDK